MAAVFSLMLHSHIPYCRKSGVWPAGEEWLFEATNETYLPLLRVLRQFKLDNIRPRLMIGIVPVLAEQSADGYMKGRFAQYMEDKIGRAKKDVERFHGDEARRRVAEYWLDRFQNHYRYYTYEFYRDILGTLKWLQDEGVVELATSAATHGFLPLLERDSSIFAQVRIGVETYRKYFGRTPPGGLASGVRLPPGAGVSGRKADEERDRRMAGRRRDRVFFRGKYRPKTGRVCRKSLWGIFTDPGSRVPAPFRRGGIRQERSDRQTGVVPQGRLSRRPELP